jgi:lipoate-protein ligase A
MRLLDLTLPDAAENLALDEALLQAAEENSAGEVLRFWELSAPAVVVGAGGSTALDVKLAACKADGVPVLRRASGGGTVLLGPGCLCFSLVLGYDSAAGLDDIRASNRLVLGRVANALKPIIGATLEGTSDLAVAGLKISGNAQQRKRSHLLHHGTILYDFNIEQLAKYIHAPERQPEYRKNRPHAVFVRSIPATSEELKQLLASEWHAECGYEPVPWESIRQLVAEKYSRAEWNRRR